MDELNDYEGAITSISACAKLYKVQYSTVGGFTVTTFTDRNLTYGYHYKTAWFTKSGRQMSKKTITHWVGLET